MSCVLSFVVPCFNVREYIAECLNSLHNVSRQYNCEVIVVNDGSTDSTMIELERWKSSFPDGLFKVIEQENRGLSEARNVGIDAAIGEYIFLLDSDDYLDVKNFSVLIDEIFLHQPDAVFFTYHWLAGPDWYWESGQLSLPEKTIISDKCLMLTSLFKDKQFYSWAKVFKKKFYQDECFPAGQNYEDIATVPRLVHKIETLYYLPVPLVFYRQRGNSIMKKKTIKNAVDLSKGTTNLPDLPPASSVAFYSSELKLYIFLWSLGDLASSQENNRLLDISYKEINSNFLSSFCRDDLRVLISTYTSRKQFKMVVKAWLAYNFPDALWKLIKVKKR
ncbi:glycosyltransferase family 2 protein [Halomonas sp. DP8Y7-3]|uniref:glycosyltransferase family 2 protein n=1 Tax=Halomonas sp. DP8Y7-3 TaxID=2859079 RepID=UPI001C96FB09|nr:glycosyltransferase family A protein [Halomonas sp. DP8Y7-3]MBY5930383.1 glycosyltransferase family 2 protein [Halomonas sp. DP8Y7-3]